MASPETRQYMESLKWETKKAGEEELSDTMVPNCVYRCGCPELGGCNFWEKFKCDFFDCGHSWEDITYIKERYDHYNYMFEEKMMAGFRND